MDSGSSDDERVDIKDMTQEEGGLLVPGTRPNAPSAAEPDPFIYGDAPSSKLDELRRFFTLVEDADYYDRVLFSGEICCCGMLLKNTEALAHHRHFVHAEEEVSCSKITCRACRKRFQTEMDLADHAQIRGRKEFFRCKICNVLTTDRVFLELHFELTRFHPVLDDSEIERFWFESFVVTVHDADNRCCGCDEEFVDGEALLEHVQITHFDGRPEHPKFACTICHQSFPNRRVLIRHLREYFGELRYVCRQEPCEYQTKDRALMKNHIDSGQHSGARKVLLSATGETTVKAEYNCCFYRCFETFKSMDQLEDHCNTHHLEQRALNHHISKDKLKHVCSLCKRYFHNEKVYRTHMKMLTTPRKVCEICNKAVAKNNFTKHKHLHRKQARSERRFFPCNLCNANYCSKSALDIHQNKKHFNILPELCHACGKRFVTRSELRQHEIRSHMEDRPYKCSQCSLAFTTKQNFQNHELTHTGARPYKCSFCDNTYRHAYDRVRHEKSVHLNDKAFACSLCDAVFIRDRDRRLHMTSHTGVKLFPCDACDYSSNLLKQLNAHRVEAHGCSESALI